MGHLGVDFHVFGCDKEASQRVDHESIDFVHTVLKVKRRVRPVHKAVMQDDGVKDCPCLKL